MSSRFLELVLAGVLCTASTQAQKPGPRQLRVCADPGNLPFSNDRGQGFENEIAAQVASALGAELHYTWRAQRRGFLRSTLDARRCDVVIGIAQGVPGVRTTRPYYRSTFAFVARADRQLESLRSFDDGRLGQLTIGVPLAGDDGANPAPVMALSRRGLVANLVGFSLWNEHAREVPAAIAAVAAGHIDVAIVWGPVAALASHQRVTLTVTPLREERDLATPLSFSIAMAVRRDDVELARQLDAVIERRRAALLAILKSHGVPLLPLPQESRHDAR